MTTPRELWLCFEPYHDVVYFTPESRAAADALGCKGGWMGYFGMRAAPLGAAPEWLITSVFYNFHPSRVARAVPEVWDIATPAQFLDARLSGVDGALRRLLGDEVTGDDLAEAAELVVAAAGAAPTAGRPLGAANAALPLPAEPHLALWQAATTLRESRGDGHIAALVTAGLDPCETLVLFAAEHGLTPEYMQQARNWPVEEWTAARTRLTERGLLDDSGLTPDGAAVRETVEVLTDEAAAAPWDHLGPEATTRLVRLLAPLSLRIARGNEAMRVNPMALAPETELERLVAET
ncbi:SCO6745 family protein [Actinokineospora fastidiosa]|uniref:SalK n=1 Tax=Actinokineospora fastidiosa TaxID=1816 RepID=A0A918LIT4_9PSEU|nr:hypothetical protein [Actinokineospora fastidiosa]GGS52833.1 hypothetical protein GCM10010171_54910 [Actinokineospora fastidiosa]